MDGSVVPLEADLEGEGGSILCRYFSHQVPLKDVDLWSRSLPMDLVKDHLTFVEDKHNWGLYFRQAALRILERDYATIVDAHMRMAN